MNYYSLLEIQLMKAETLNRFFFHFASFAVAAGNYSQRTSELKGISDYILLRELMSNATPLCDIFSFYFPFINDLNYENSLGIQYVISIRLLRMKPYFSWRLLMFILNGRKRNVNMLAALLISSALSVYCTSISFFATRLSDCENKFSSTQRPKKGKIKKKLESEFANSSCKTSFKKMNST
jgi:hypothetical protein